MFTYIDRYINIWYLQMKMNVRGTLAWMEPLVTILLGHSLVSALRDSWAICVIMVKFTQFLIRFIIEDNCNISNCFSFIKERVFLAWHWELFEYNCHSDKLFFFIDTNECLQFPGICRNGGTCFNTEGSYKCDCPLGWRGKNCGIGKHKGKKSVHCLWMN